MKTIQCIVLIAMMTFAACMVPAETDFVSEAKPLSKEEMVVNWRFSRYANEAEVMDTTEVFAAEMERYMDPLFQQVIPQIFSDIKNGKLIIREERDVSNLDEEVIADFYPTLNKFRSGNNQGTLSFMTIFHVSQRRSVSTRGFNAEELELTLVWKDPENKLPEHTVGSVRMEDLEKLGYKVEVDGTTYDLLNYLAKEKEYAYPVEFVTTEKVIGIYTLEQAFFAKERLLNGAWNTIEWLGGQPNQTSFSYLPLPEDELSKYEGAFIFKPGQGSDLTKGPIPIMVDMTLKNGNLRAKWSNQEYYHNYEIFPASSTIFFTADGDQIQFSQQPDGKLQMSILTKPGDRVVGYRD